MTKQNANARTLSRRAAITTVAAAPLAGQFSVGLAASDEVAQLVQRAAAKNAAFMRGDMDGWLALVHIAPELYVNAAVRGTNQSRV